jgi:hypothetical protein
MEMVEAVKLFEWDIDEHNIGIGELLQERAAIVAIGSTDKLAGSVSAERQRSAHCEHNCWPPASRMTTLLR